MKFDLQTALKNPQLVIDNRGRPIRTIRYISESMETYHKVLVTFLDGSVQFFSEQGIAAGMGNFHLEIVKDQKSHDPTLKVIDWRLFAINTLIQLPSKQLVRFHKTNGHFVSYFAEGADSITSQNTMKTRDARIVMDSTVHSWLGMKRAPVPEGVAVKVFYFDGNQSEFRSDDFENSGSVDWMNPRVFAYSVNGVSPGWSPFFVSTMETADRDSYSSATESSIEPNVSIDQIVANNQAIAKAQDEKRDIPNVIRKRND